MLHRLINLLNQAMTAIAKEIFFAHKGNYFYVRFQWRSCSLYCGLYAYHVYISVADVMRKGQDVSFCNVKFLVRKGTRNVKDLWILFTTFCRIGAFTFGGGYAMLPMLQKEVVENHKWATEDEVLDYFAIGQCTPGVIFVNTATFVGYKRKGVPGAVAATLGSVFPSLVIVMVIAAALSNFAELAAVQHAFAAIRVIVSVLIINAVAGMWKKSVVDKICAVIAVGGFLVSVIFDISPVWVVLAAGILGIAISVGKEATGK